MTLALIELASGREVKLVSLEVWATYSALLEGYPCARINDRKLAAFATCTADDPNPGPVHVIQPPRRYPGGSGPFGPVEELPAVCCRACFQAWPISTELDQALHRSGLTVAWFQDNLAAPVADFVTAAVADLSWDELAADHQL